MIPIQPVKRITVTEQVMEQIAALITNGQLKPGQQLPNERDLAKRFGVTRGRIREALRALSLIGLITIKSGEGSFVNPQGVPIQADAITWMFHQERHNLDEVYAARKLIETEVYMSAADRLPQNVISEIAVMLQQLKEALPHMNEVAFLDGLDQCDLKIGEHCGNQIYSKLMQTMVHLRRETSLKLLRDPGAKEDSIRSRLAICKALESGSRNQVRKAVNAFFTSSKQFYRTLKPDK